MIQSSSSSLTDMGIGGLRLGLRKNTVKHYRGFLVAHNSLLFIAEIPSASPAYGLADALLDMRWSSGVAL